jgi:hypothetical protein
MDAKNEFTEWNYAVVLVQAISCGSLFMIQYMPVRAELTLPFPH